MTTHARSTARLIVRALLLACIALLPVAFSAWIDPAHVLGAPAAEVAIAQALAAGHYVTNVMNYDERAIAKRQATLPHGRPDVLAIGSSRMQPLSRDAFPGLRFTSVAVSGARLDDFLGLYDLYARADRRPKRVLLALDPWSLSGDGNAILWGAIASERAEMLDTLRIPHSTLRDRIRLELSALVRLGSPEYFRLAVLSLRHHGVHGIHYVVTDVAQNVEKTKAPDGSIVWSPVSPDSADFMAREYVRRIRAHIASYDGRDEPSDGSLATLERFLLRLKHDGVSTDIVLSPFHPFVYAELVQQPGASINEVEREYRIVASRVGARVFGSYDPATVGMTGADFFDESHMRSASLARLVR